MAVFQLKCSTHTIRKTYIGEYLIPIPKDILIDNLKHSDYSIYKYIIASDRSKWDLIVLDDDKKLDEWVERLKPELNLLCDTQRERIIDIVDTTPINLLMDHIVLKWFRLDKRITNIDYTNKDLYALFSSFMETNKIKHKITCLGMMKKLIPLMGVRVVNRVKRYYLLSI